MTISSFIYVLLHLVSAIALAEAGWVGVNYGRLANNIPPPAKVVQLLKQHGIDRVKIFDTDDAVLTALANSGISVIVCLPNQQLASISSDQSVSNQWVKDNIAPYYPATKIEAIAIGNEVFVDPTNITQYLVLAMNKMHAALTNNNLGTSIKISSPIAYTALESSYPTSSGTFKQELVEPVMKPMLDFFRTTGSYLMMNVYPFFAYSANTDKISLDYAVFRNNPGVVDSGSGLKYTSLFEAQVDAVYAAMSALKYDDIKLVITETGWPSKGDKNEVGSSVANAAAYNGNLVRRVLTGSGTPMRPKDTLGVYLFALFNENEKTGPTSERNYGLFYPNEQRVYDIPLTRAAIQGGGTSTPPSGGQSQPQAPSPDMSPPSSNGQTWCVAKGNVGEEKLQEGLSYACGQGGADCGPIQPGGTCYNPDSLEAHASYAFNSYYQKNARDTKACDFGGSAQVVTQPPQYGQCKFSTSDMSPPSNGQTSTPNMSPPSSNGQTWCVAKGNVGEEKLQEGLSYACGQGGADCGPIQPGGTCYNPESLEAHASYAFNSYYQKKARATEACDFGGSAQVVNQPPQYGQCKFPTTSSGNNDQVPTANLSPPSNGQTSTPDMSPPSSNGQTWCVAKGNVGEQKLQDGLSYACGQGGADCGPIQPGGTCYNPDSLEAHASYAFNSYYQKKARATEACDFGGSAQVVTQPPQYGQCKFSTADMSPPSNGQTSTPNMSPPSSNGQTWCVAKGNVGEEKLQEGLSYACGQGGADCGPIQPGGTCYNPESLEAHASYAFNSYYQKKARATEACDFGGTAQVVTQPPQYGQCKFPTTSSGSNDQVPTANLSPPSTDQTSTPDMSSPSSNGQTWCVAKGNVGEQKLQKGLSYACGQGGADCSAIQPGGTCYNPDSLEAHASYAFNSYYQKNARATEACDFEGSAQVVTQPPQYGQCKFSTAGMSPPSNGQTSTPNMSPPSSNGQTWCVAKGNVGEEKLQEGLSYACGQGGADCGPIQPGGTCYNPESLEAHASYAFNSYYQKKARATEACDFGGSAQVVTQPPQYGQCKFPTTSSGSNDQPPTAYLSPPANGQTSTPDTSSNGQTWCVANGNAGEEKLKEGLSYACGQVGADCDPIQPGGMCFQPDSLEAHASWAFNSYYQKKGRATEACDFGGSAKVITQEPQFGQCKFPTAPMSESKDQGPTADSSPPSNGQTPTPDTSSNVLTWCMVKWQVEPEKLKEGLKFACEQGGADCGPIQPGGKCYNSNLLDAHASYAFNSYYQKKGRAAEACDFGGAAQVVSQPPRYGLCDFPPEKTQPQAPAPETSPSLKGQTWCVANEKASQEKLEDGMIFACGEGGADCTPLQPGKPCYNPNSLVDQASYVYNSYYQKMGRASGSCDFKGTAYVVTQPPGYGDCKFPTEF